MALIIPGMRGRMGDTDFYQATMKACDLVKGVRPAKELDEWASMSIEDRLQREPDLKRIEEEIAPYIAEANDRFFGAMIVLIYKGKIDFESIQNWVSSKAPRSYQSAVNEIGIITIDGGSLIMLDNWRQVKEKEKLSSVVFVVVKNIGNSL